MQLEFPFTHQYGAPTNQDSTQDSYWSLSVLLGCQFQPEFAFVKPIDRIYWAQYDIEYRYERPL